MTAGWRQREDKSLCTQCEKPLDGANKYRCKACAREYRAGWLERRGQSDGAYQAKWRAANPGKQKGYMRTNRLKSYGLDHDSFASMRAAQKNQCAMCHAEMTDERGPHQLHIDHDHVTGQMRELLCQRCNLLLGAAGDDQWVLSQGITYLRRHRLRKVI